MKCDSPPVGTGDVGAFNGASANFSSVIRTFSTEYFKASHHFDSANALTRKTLSKEWRTSFVKLAKYSLCQARTGARTPL